MRLCTPRNPPVRNLGLGRMDLVIHEELSIEASRTLEPRRDVDGLEAVRLLTIGSSERSIVLEIRVTPTALCVLEGRGIEVDEFVQERVVNIAGSYPNDGQKLDRLKAISPLALGSDQIPD